MTLTEFQPIQVGQIEIGTALANLPIHTSPTTNTTYPTARLMVTLYHQPIGIVWVPLPPATTQISADQLASLIWQAHATAINATLTRNGVPPVATLTAAGIPAPTAPLPHCLAERQAAHAAAPFISVIVCTRNRTVMLAQCLPRLLKLDYPHYEVIVVDNAPSDSSTAQLVAQLAQHNARLRYVSEMRVGLSRAGNTGLHHARGEIVAFTDDDVQPAADWLTALVVGFRAADNVGCVTGYTLPAELETQAQYWFEEFGGFNKGRGFKRLIYDLAQHRPPNNPLYPYIPGIFGAGANMAFRTATLRQIGGFDLALGGGSVIGGGGDIDAFFRVIMSGAQLVYEPSALLSHFHRRELAKLHTQLGRYGKAFGAFLTKTILVRPSRVFDLVQRVPAAVPYLFSPASPRNISKSDSYPAELTRGELWGMVRGTRAYFASYHHAYASPPPAHAEVAKQ